MLPKPSARQYASTDTCLVSPTTSAKGAIKGITIAAFPEAEGMKKLNTKLTMYINTAEMADGTFVSGSDNAYIIVCIIFASVMMIEIAFAKPISNAP